jgi:general secretion pathway protein D
VPPPPAETPAEPAKTKPEAPEPAEPPKPEPAQPPKPEATPPPAEPAKPQPDAAQAEALPAPPAALEFAPDSVEVQPDATVTVVLNATNVSNLFTAPLKVKFDPKVLRLTGIQPGSLMSADGQKINFSENTQSSTGESAVTLNRMPGSGGVSGSGALITLTFQAVGSGTTMISVVDAAFKNLQMQPVEVNQPSMTVVVE